MSSGKTESINVLQVDDDQSILEISRQIILEIDPTITVEVISRVEDAIKKLATEKFDVVISDYAMPDKNGLDFLKELRKQNIAVPFILFTGKGREEIAIQALNIGADGYFNKQGNPETVYGELVHGIKAAHARKQAEKNIKKEETLRNSLLDNIPCTALILEKQTHKIVASNKIARQQGAVPGETCYSTFAKRSAPCLFCLAPKLWETNIAQSLEVEYEGKFYRFVWVPYSDDLYIHYIFDITERKNSEQKLKENDQKYRLLADNSEDVIWTMNLDGHFTYVSPSVFKLRGYTPEEVMKQSMVEVLTPESAQIILEGMAHFYQTGEVPQNYFELDQPCKDGSIVHTEVNFSVIRDKNGDPESILGVSRNIGKRKKTEQLINESEARYRSLFSSMNEGVGLHEVIYDDSGKAVDYKIIDVNPAYEKLTDISNQTAVGALASQLYGAGEPPYLDVYAKVAETGTPASFETYFEPMKKHFSISVFSPSKGKFATIFTDTTQQKKVQEELSKSNAKYRALVENADEAILMSDLKGNTLYQNPAYFKQLGFKEGESCEFAKIHPEDMPLIKKNMSKLLKCGNAISEYRIRHRNGSWVYRLARSSLLYNQKQEPYAILSVIRDVTEQKNAEEKLREDQIRIGEMNEKLRVFSSLTRHDVRNKLNAIVGNAYLLKKKNADRPDVVEGLCKMEQLVLEAGKIFDFAKAYEQLGAEKLVPVDVFRAVDEAATQFSSLPFKVINQCHDLTVIADSMLRQLIYNLIDNTKKYGKKTTTVKIYYQKNKDTINLIYEDDGTGIPLEDKPNLFTKHFSTGGSTGLGLFLIKKLVEVYGWKITEEGEPDKGAKFKITIPANQLDNIEEK